MQIRFTKIYGLEPVEQESPVAPAKVLVFGSVAALLILAGAYLFGVEASSSTAGQSHVIVRPAARSTITAPAAAADPIPPQTFVAVTPEQALVMNEQVPFSVAPNPPAAPFKMSTASSVDQTRALTCLTMAIYYEAATQGDVGEAAVAQVVLNRVRNPAFPKTVCGVVFQGSTLPTGCQFTFTCDGSLNRTPNPVAWTRASLIAHLALNGYVEPLVGQATHYHTVWVVPYWQSTVEKVAQIGAHIFYRWTGAAGQARPMNAAYAGAEPLPPNVTGFNLGPELAASSEPAVAAAPEPSHEAPAPHRVVLAATDAASAGRSAAVTLSSPVLPQQLTRQPEALHVDNPQAEPEPPRHLAMPAGW